MRPLGKSLPTLCQNDLSRRLEPNQAQAHSEETLQTTPRPHALIELRNTRPEAAEAEDRFGGEPFNKKAQSKAQAAEKPTLCAINSAHRRNWPFARGLFDAKYAETLRNTKTTVMNFSCSYTSLKLPWKMTMK